MVTEFGRSGKVGEMDIFLNYTRTKEHAPSGVPFTAHAGISSSTSFRAEI